jgi:hypothetical protein
MRERRVIAVLLAALLVALAAPAAASAQAQPKGTDVLGQLFGREKGGNDLGSYPLSRYALDWDVDTDVDTPIGPVAPKPGGVLADTANEVSQAVWAWTLIIVKLMGGVFAWAWSLDVLTGPHGILRPLGAATNRMYRDLFGREILWAAIAVGGAYGLLTFKGGRRGAGVAVFAAAVVYSALAAGVSSNLQATATPMFKATQEISSSVLTMTANGAQTQDGAEAAATRQLGNAFVAPAYLMLQFGGTVHCVNPSDVRDGYPVPVLPDDPGVKTCRSNERYARAFLAEPPGTDERKQVLKDLASGEGRFDRVDAPAADMMLQGNAYIRLAIAVATLFGVILVGAFVFTAGIFIVISTVLFAVALAFAPVMAPAAFIPVYGEALVRFWASLLGGLLAIKVAYSLVIGVLIQASTALTTAAGAVLPVGLAYGVNVLMFVGAVAYRKRIKGGVSSSVARLDGRGGSALGSSVAHPVRAMTGRVAWAAATGAIAGKVAGHEAAESRGAAGKSGSSGPGGGDAPPFTEAPRDHRPPDHAPPPRGAAHPDITPPEPDRNGAGDPEDVRPL